MNAKVRLYVEHPLGQGQSVPLDRDQAHYLFGVMAPGRGGVCGAVQRARRGVRAEVAEAGKRGGVLACAEQTKPLQLPPDLWLLFAPIKKARTDFIVEKAAEMGAARIQPVQTDFTNSERIRQDRLQAHAVRGGGTMRRHLCARSGRFEETVAPAGSMATGAPLMFCDEAEVGNALQLAVEAQSDASWAILIGPEGGFPRPNASACMRCRSPMLSALAPAFCARIQQLSRP